MVVNTHYKENLKAVMQVAKNYTDDKIEQALELLEDYELSSETISQTSQTVTAPSDVRTSSLIEVGGNCVKYAPSTASDNSVAYKKSIPNNTYKLFANKVGGMSYKSENLILLNDVAETTTGGITYKVENGVITFITGTAGSGGMSITFDLINQLPSGTYYYKNFGSGTRNIGIRLSDNSTVWGSNSGASYNISSSIIRIYFYFGSGDTVNNEVYKPMLVVGSTAPTEFEQGFTGIRDSAVTSVVFRGIGQTDITKQIPSQIQALAGYGWGINDTCYNYIDLNRKVFVQKVGREKVTDLAWEVRGTKYYRAINTVNCKRYGGNTVGTGLSNLFNICTYNQIGNAPYTNYTDMAFPSENENQFYVGNGGTTDLTDFLSKIANEYIYFELATPVETDISQYLTDFNPIETNDLYGEIEFVNTYNQDMPNEISFVGTIKETLVNSFTIGNETTNITDTIESDGWSVSNSIYNTRKIRDRERTKRVGRVKVKDLTFNTTSVANMFSTNGLSNVIKLVANNETANLLCNVLVTETANNVYAKRVLNSIGVVNNGGLWVYINDNISTVEELTNYFTDNDYIYFELATPETTPLNVTKDFHYIDLESGETITFNNANNQACHNTIRYSIMEEKV